jgi:hypothetical protein
VGSLGPTVKSVTLRETYGARLHVGSEPVAHRTSSRGLNFTRTVAFRGMKYSRDPLEQGAASRVPGLWHTPCWMSRAARYGETLRYCEVARVLGVRSRVRRRSRDPGRGECAASRRDGGRKRHRPGNADTARRRHGQCRSLNAATLLCPEAQTLGHERNARANTSPTASAPRSGPGICGRVPTRLAPAAKPIVLLRQRGRALQALRKRLHAPSLSYGRARMAARISLRWTALMTLTPATAAGSVYVGGVRPAAW